MRGGLAKPGGSFFPDRSCGEKSHDIEHEHCPRISLFHSLVSTLGALPLEVGYLSQDCSDHSKQKMLVVVEETIWQLHIWVSDLCGIFQCPKRSSRMQACT